MEKAWWKEAVVYQIYPRSFNDSNNDGIGDIPGIIEKVDYIKSLGVNVIWLCPVYKSPNDDNGYDISDYRSIMDEFGTLSDWELLLNKLHENDIKLVMDLVVNHSSDEHYWFTEAKKSRDNKYRNYYIFREGKNGNPPNNWGSVFSGPAWEYNESTDDYYLHIFSKKQPDLNWENPKLRNEVYDLMKFWLDKGIDGFRMDVINFIAKEPGLPDDRDQSYGNYGNAIKFLVNQPKLHDYLKEMNREVLSKYDIMTVGECGHISPEDGYMLTGSDRKELDMIFSFDHMFIDMDLKGSRYNHKDWSLSEFKKIFLKWHKGLYQRAWNSMFLGNHDFARSVSRFGNDGEFRDRSAKLLSTFLLSMPGTPYIFQGDEIGMTNCRFNSISEHRDIEVLNYFKEELENGRSEQELLEATYSRNRDNARTPMQWNSDINAGFTKGEPWIKLNPNYKEINVDAEEKNSDSILNYYRKMISIRKEHKTLVYGDLNIPEIEREDLCIIERASENERYIALLNFIDSTINFDLKRYLSEDAELLISNYPDGEDNYLKPYEARLYKCS